MNAISPPPSHTTNNGSRGADSPKAEEPAAHGKTRWLPISRRDQYFKARDTLQWDWKCSGPLKVRLTTKVNVTKAPFHEQPQQPPSCSASKQNLAWSGGFF